VRILPGSNKPVEASWIEHKRPIGRIGRLFNKASIEDAETEQPPGRRMFAL
jgi:hypothetical protein